MRDKQLEIEIEEIIKRGFPKEKIKKVTVLKTLKNLIFKKK